MYVIKYYVYVRRFQLRKAWKRIYLLLNIDKGKNSENRNFIENHSIEKYKK